MVGKVLDSVSQQPVEYATISLIDNENHQAVTGSISDKFGLFSVGITKTASYTVLIESIGFLPYRREGLVLNKNTFRDLGKIKLNQNISNLKDVTVVGGQKLIENKIDKMVFNAEKDLTSQGGVATDILKKIPQVSVDVDGNVELAGNTSIRFLIDGKPSTAFGSNITDVLQSIPASQIKSIEVITNPGAKYDTEGLGGIINIILKHNQLKGVNGSVSVTAASRNENGSLNLSVRNGNFGINAFVNGNFRLPATTPSTSTRISQDTSSKTQVNLYQDGSSRFIRYGIESGISLDYNYHKRNNFTLSASNNYFGTTNNGYQNQHQSTSDYNGNPLSQVLTFSQTQSDFKLHNINLSLDYKRTFEKEDQELDIGIHTSMGSNDF